MSHVIYNACAFMDTTIGFKGHLEQIYATEEITQQICRFKDVINYKIAFSA